MRGKIAFGILSSFVLISFFSCEKEIGIQEEIDTYMVEQFRESYVASVSYYNEGCTFVLTDNNNVSIPFDSYNIFHIDSKGFWNIGAEVTEIQSKKNTPPNIEYYGSNWIINGVNTGVTTRASNSNSCVDHIVNMGDMVIFYLENGTIIECPIIQKCFSISQVGNDYHITRDFDGESDVTISIGPCGINLLYQIKGGAYYLKDGTPTSVGFRSRTDWIGPYVVHAVEDNGTVKVQPADIYNGYYISRGGNLCSNVMFNVEVYSLNAGDQIELIISNGSGGSVAWALYNDKPLSSETLLNQGGLLKFSNGTNRIIANQNCYLAISKYPFTSYSITKIESQYVYNNTINNFTGG